MAAKALEGSIQRMCATIDRLEAQQMHQPALWPDKAQRHDGVIAHVDDTHIYQQVGKNFVMHSRENFDIVPSIGSAKGITYDATGKAQVSADALKLSRARSR